MNQIVVMAVLSTVVTVTLVLADPFGLAHQSTNFASMVAVAVEAFALIAPGIAVALLLQRHTERLGRFIAMSFCFAVPLVMLLNALTWRWIGEHFLSIAMWRVATDLRSGLAGHITLNIVLGIGYLVLAVMIVAAVMLWLSHLLAKAWIAYRRLPGPTPVFASCVVLATVASLICLRDVRSVRTAIELSPFQHPLSVVRIMDPAADEKAVVRVRPASTEIDLATAVLARQQQQRLLAIKPNRPRPPTPLPDVLVVIIESFRRELVTSEVMPNLYGYAEQGLFCRSHFSGGNATNHGMFSLVNGLEAIWHESPVRYSPLMNRLLKQAGFELGFFGGHNDWRKFQMDGYISAEQFDLFEVGVQRGLDSDRQAVQSAASYLQRRPSNAAQRPPRLAVLYLYATHAPYRSYIEDQVFSPAADDRFLIPYTAVSHDKVWHRYKNSARTVDRLLKSVLRDDRLIIVTGDHGESFLDDGTIGHGVRLSEFQNMTPAIVFAPGKPLRMIDAPTMHADLLPTLLAVLGINVSDDVVFDGVDLLATSNETLRRRVFVTRNYLNDDVAVIGSWTSDANEPFAYTASVSLPRFHAMPLGAIDRRGITIDIENSNTFEGWLEARFGKGRFSNSPLGF